MLIAQVDVTMMRLRVYSEEDLCGVIDQLYIRHNGI